MVNKRQKQNDRKQKELATSAKPIDSELKKMYLEAQAQKKNLNLTYQEWLLI
jgi:hypothetical protein